MRHVQETRKERWSQELAGSANHVPDQSGLAHLDVPHARVHDCRLSHGHEGREGLGVGIARTDAGSNDGVLIINNAEALAVVSTTQRSNVSIVHSGEDRDRSSGADVLVRVLVDERLDLVVGPCGLVEQDVVVNGACSTLDGSVCTKVEVVLVRLSNARLDESAGQSVGVLVTTRLGEETNVVTLRSNDNQELGRSLPDLDEGLSHGSHLLVDDLGELTLRNTIAEVDDGCGSSALVNLVGPTVLDE